ncbi:hypothetical protein [Micromonospora echinofusca]|uniref:Uncharacterized protein n=1 Tax=Micromonospora echinofusca TaxID=47858 RepID=A0A1C5G296_MICEH|nr:hypothetical protein [Micromonospora echinofusca]SCG13871.1 hypothetical protein GA0070610_0062 [Micromonospora echinofusca]
MPSASRSRAVRVPVAALLVVALAGCSLPGNADDAPAPGPVGTGSSRSGPGGVATAGKGEVSLLQRVGTNGPLRTLNVAPDGRWECVDCAGDGVTSTGVLGPEHVTRLQGLLADPGLAKETDQVRRYQVTCIDALTSSLVTSAGLVTSQDCPGEEHPPIAHEILLLLTQATPAEPTA